MKNNHRITSLLAVIMLLGSSITKAQSGIYLTLNDYKHDVRSYRSDSAHTSIRTHDFFGHSQRITVVANGIRHTYNKAAIFGYRDGENNVYRFYKNAAYRIAEMGNICIYIQERNITQSKGFKVVNAWFFSTTPDGPIMPLSYNNLREACKTNEEFINKLDQYCAATEIQAYDKAHNTFRINYVYSLATNTK